MPSAYYARLQQPASRRQAFGTKHLTSTVQPSASWHRTAYIHRATCPAAVPPGRSRVSHVTMSVRGVEAHGSRRVRRHLATPISLRPSGAEFQRSRDPLRKYPTVSGRGDGEGGGGAFLLWQRRRSSGGGGGGGRAGAVVIAHVSTKGRGGARSARGTRSYANLKRLGSNLQSWWAIDHRRIAVRGRGMRRVGGRGGCLALAPGLIDPSTPSWLETFRSPEFRLGRGLTQLHTEGNDR